MLNQYLLQAVMVMKDRESLQCRAATGQRRQKGNVQQILVQCDSMDWILGQKEGCYGRPGEIQIKPKV